MKQGKMSKALAWMLALVMVITMMPAQAFAAAGESGTTPEQQGVKKGTATVTMLHETKEEPSMCNKLFAEKADIEVKDGQAMLKMYVAFPVPAFANQGKDGTIKNVVMKFGGNQYTAESDITTKPVKPARETNSAFGLVAGEELQTQIISVTLPEEAITENIEIETNAYVNVFMESDVVFRTKLTNILWDGEDAASKYNFVGTTKIEINASKAFVAPDGKSYKPSDVVKIPNKEEITFFNVFEQNAEIDEVPLYEKDGKYYVNVKWQAAYPQMGLEYVPIEFNKACVDLNNLQASQEQIAIDQSKKVDDTFKTTMIELGTKDTMNNLQFYWTKFEMQKAGMTLQKYYDVFSIKALPEYEIGINQSKKMVEDGEYLANYTMIKDGHEVDTNPKAFKLINNDQKVPVSVENGIATIRLEGQRGVKGMDYRPKYAIYGEKTSNELMETAEIPRENGESGYIYVKTNDLRKVIGVDDNWNTEFIHLNEAIKINMDSMIKNENPENINMLDDGNYTTNIQILDDTGKELKTLPLTTENLKVKAQYGKIRITVPYDENGQLTQFKRYTYGEYTDNQAQFKVDEVKHTVEVILYHQDYTAKYSVLVNGVEQKFQVKIVPDTLKEVTPNCNKEDGNYLIDVETLREDSDRVSMAGDYLEKLNIPVRVKDGAMFMTLDVKTSNKELDMSDLITNIKHEFNSKLRNDTFIVTDPSKYGDGIDRITTEMRIDNLETPIITSIYVTAMGSWATFRIIPNLDTLKTVAPTDTEAATLVIDQIKAISDVKLTSETAITEAKSAYDKLTDVQKALVKNLPALTAAEAKLVDLKAADAVDKKIEAIGSVTLEKETAITEARGAYTNLTEAQKALVQKLNVLTAAETRLDELKNPVIPTPPSVKEESRYTQMLHERNNKLSMCDIMFSEKADITIEDGQATVKLLVADPVPAFPQNEEGTVKNFVVNYNGQKYTATSEMNGEKMIAKDTNESFGFEKGKEYLARTLTFTLPEAALEEELTVNAFVNVVMNTDVTFRMNLTTNKLPKPEDTVTPDVPGGDVTPVPPVEPEKPAVKPEVTPAPILPVEPPKEGADLGMDKDQQIDADKTIGDIITDIVKPEAKPEPPKTEAEKETAATEEKIAEAAKNNDKIKVNVETEKVDEEKASDAIKKEIADIKDKVNEIYSEVGGKLLQFANIEVTATAVKADGTTTDLGNLRNLDKKLSFTFQLPKDTEGDKFGVIRYHDGKAEIIPATDVKYDPLTKKITFLTDKFSTYAVFAYDKEPEVTPVPPVRPAKVQNLKVRTDYGLLKVTFDKSKEDVELYRIAVRKHGDKAWKYYETKNNSLIIKKLNGKALVKSARYDVMVAAVKDKSENIRSYYTKVKTVYANKSGVKAYKMYSPKFESIKRYNSGKTKVVVRNVKYTGETYQVAFRVKGTKTWKNTHYNTKTVRYIKGLKKGKTYEFRVNYRYKSKLDGKTYVTSKNVYKTVKLK